MPQEKQKYNSIYNVKQIWNPPQKVIPALAPNSLFVERTLNPKRSKKEPPPFFPNKQWHHLKNHPTVLQQTRSRFTDLRAQASRILQQGGCGSVGALLIKLGGGGFCCVYPPRAN